MRTDHETSFGENKCDECEYKNGTRVQIMYHMRTYHETENKCDECEYKNDTRVQIMYHMRTDHETSFGENKCDECEYKNDTRVQIMYHMRTYHETCFVYQLRISIWVDMQKKKFSKFFDDFMSS